MRILFINPCLRRNHQTKIVPVGLVCVMTYVKEHGYKFDFLDLDVNDYDDQYVEKFIKDNQYDVILYSTIVTHYKWIKWLTHTIKNYWPETKVVIGNSVAGSCYKVFLNNAPADEVIIGEGEITCLETLNAFSDGLSIEGIEGIAYREASGKIVKTPPRKACDINDLPMVSWEFFDIPKYMERNEWTSFGNLGNEPAVTFPVNAARGCAFRYTFCHFVYWDDPYRYRSPETIVAEIKRNMEEYGADYINFWDDLSFASIGQVEKLVDAILESGLKFRWSASIRTDLFGHPRNSREKRLEVAKKMKESGCKAVGFSLESADPEILEMMNKKVEVEYFEEHVQILKEAGITSQTSVVFGYPIETHETIQQTFDLCLKNKLYPGIGFLLPLPYTGMYDYAKEHGFIKDENAYLDAITERQDICINLTNLSDEEIMKTIQQGAQQLNKILKIGLNDETLIRTGGPKRHTNVKEQLDPDAISRIENDVSFNYSEAVFDEDRN